MARRAAGLGHRVASGVIWLFAAAAVAGEVWHATPGRDAQVALVVATPGFARSAYVPLTQGLADAGVDVHVLTFGCGEEDAAALSAEVASTLQALGPETAVVAHGVGAVPALQALGQVDAERVVLLAPVLDVWPVEAMRWAVEQDVDWTASVSWHGRDVREVLLGTIPELGCAPAPFVDEVRGWVRAGSVPLALDAVDEPVAIAVSTLDAVAAVEAVVEASRRLPHRSLTRLGIEAFQRQDFDHGAMLLDPTPIGWAVHEVTARRPSASP